MWLRLGGGGWLQYDPYNCLETRLLYYFQASTNLVESICFITLKKWMHVKLLKCDLISQLYGSHIHES